MKKGKTNKKKNRAYLEKIRKVSANEVDPSELSGKMEIMRADKLSSSREATGSLFIHFPEGSEIKLNFRLARREIAPNGKTQESYELTGIELGRGIISLGREVIKMGKKNLKVSP